MRITAIVLLATLAAVSASNEYHTNPNLPDKKDGNRRLRGDNLAMNAIAGMFKADVAIPVALQKDNHGRKLDQVECSFQTNGDIVCTDFPRLGLSTTFFGCPADLQSVEECQTCQIDEPSTGRQCDVCSICLEDDQDVGFDCGNIDTGIPQATNLCDEPRVDPTDPSGPSTPGGNPTGISCVFTYD